MKKLRLLVGCESSATVRRAFAALGWDAWSCDLQESEHPGQHYQCDVREVLGLGWDLFICHPDCTYLTVSANRWLKDQPERKSGALVGEARRQAQVQAAAFFMQMIQASVKRICVENPIGIMSTLCCKPSQIIQPWKFGHGETKATCLWLKGLPRLQFTNVVEGREQRIFKMSPGPERWKERSRTYPGIAAAMAKQWTDYILSITKSPLPYPTNHKNP